MTADVITIRGARLHNLKNITLSIPKNQLVVLTGLSGSGKSTLGFDILLKEGQRQYLESLGLVTWGLSKPPVDGIDGLSPTISVDQHLANHSPRSTVGTATEVYTYLRILYARLGSRPCPNCGFTVPPQIAVAGTAVAEAAVAEAAVGDAAAATALDDDDSPAPDETFPCPRCSAPLPVLSMANFSFNKPEGACPTCTGLGVVREANLAALIDPRKSLPEGAVLGWEANYRSYILNVFQAAARYYGLALDLAAPVGQYSPALRDLLTYGVQSPRFRRHFPDLAPPSAVRDGRFEGVATALLRRYEDSAAGTEYREKMDALLITQTCPECAGARLKPESRAVSVDGRTIVEAARVPLGDLGAWLERLRGVFGADEMQIAAPVLDDLHERVARLVEVGAGYLTMERASPTLSAGEAQRLRLAALLGSGLSGLLYVFDEPTIGLHQRDTRRLISVLRRLRDLGNTVLVIEHDLETIAAADYLVDFGPGAGKHGGQVVAAGTPGEVASMAGQPGMQSQTAAYLAGSLSIAAPHKRRAPSNGWLVLRGARRNNLKNIDVRFPLGLFTAVTGVSGSGKSSLVFDILDRAARALLAGGEQGSPGSDYDALEGWQALERVVTIDQSPIGRVPRSNAATYADIFTPIRAAFAAQPEARLRGLTARHFSFNVPGGRCERCEGAGVLTVNMHFLPGVEVRCPVCRGRRFTRETLAVHYQGRDIAQVLEMTVEEALALFAGVPAARSRLQVLSDVGLGYLPLGQPATTLSGGEAQRVKLAKELGRRDAGRALYLLDEPTTGLHLADTARLLNVLARLVKAGGTLIVVEHNLELVKTADWVIDLGPEGGAAGGEIVAEGPPEAVAQAAGSHTGRYLKELL